jgi:hypothetical protein
VASGKKRPMRLLLLSVLSLILILFVVFMLPPSFVIDLSGIKLSVVPFLFLFTGIFVFSVVTYIFGNAKHGILASLFVLIYFWLRLNKLFHPMFTLLLVALFLTLELLFSARKEH